MKSLKTIQKVAPRGIFKKRKLRFKNLTVIIIFKSSIQRESDRFFKIVNKNDFNIREVTEGALSQALAKLNPNAFKRLNEVACNIFYAEAAYYIWYGFRVLALDVRIAPNISDLIQIVPRFQ